MKVLHVAESIKGGIATQLIALWHHQAAAYGADNVRLAVPAPHVADLAGVDDASIRALPVAPRGASGIAAHLWAVHAAVREEMPDLVHAHSAFAGGATRLLKAAGLCAPPIVYCPHGWAFDRAPGPVARSLYRVVEAILARWSDAIVCISKHDYRHGRRAGIPRSRLRLVYNGLPVAPEPTAATPSQPEASPPPAVLRIAFVGRLDRQKGFDILQAAVSKMTRPAKVVCVGDAVLGDAADGRVACRDDRIAFRGWLPPAGVAAELRRADVAVVPSRWEGFGLVAAEALREGTPVIATRRGGLPEVVAHDVTGEIVAEPEPQALARTLDNLERTRLTRWQRATQRRFDAYFRGDAMAARTTAIYAALTGTAATQGQEAEWVHSKGHTTKSQRS